MHWIHLMIFFAVGGKLNSGVVFSARFCVLFPHSIIYHGSYGLGPIVWDKGFECFNGNCNRYIIENY